MSPAARKVSAQALLVATCLLLIAATLAAYATRALFDSDRFAERAAAALQAPAVRQAVGDRVTDELVLPREADLLTARPLIAAAVGGAVGGDAFAGLFRRAVRDAHGAVFQRDRDTVTMTLADVGIVVAAAISQLDPQLAARLESNERLELLSRDLGAATGDLARQARDVRVLALVLAALALGAALAAVAVSPDRRGAAARVGVAAIVAGIVVVAVELLARAVVVDRAGDDAAVTAAVWDAFLGDLRTAGWLVAAVGAVLAAAATAIIQPVGIERPLRAAWRWLRAEPQHVGARIARAAVLIAAGALVVAGPEAALLFAARLAGVYVLYKGVEAILRLIGGPARVRAPRVRSRRRFATVAVAVAATLIVAALGAGFVAAGGADAPAPAEITRCNGRADLCDRPLDAIALPATHNSMSVPLPGWFAALQERPIGGQLEAGIRGLLFDTHYADRLASGRTRTYFASPEEFREAIAQDAVSDQSVQAAERLRGRLGFRGGGERGMYLCHTFCELGSTPLGDVLDDIHAFLVTHPAEVVVVINQDYVSPQDFVGAIGDARLTPYMIEPPRGRDWPTLRELIERDERLLVMAENTAGAAPWYQLAYERLTQETPFSFAGPAQLVDPQTLAPSCRPNRGRPDAPLFLLNHWINTDPVPRPGNAEIVNAYEPLLRRARTCERDRERNMNLVAVDFYERGDLFAVVDTLNRR